VVLCCDMGCANLVLSSSLAWASVQRSAAVAYGRATGPLLRSAQRRGPLTAARGVVCSARPSAAGFALDGLQPSALEADTIFALSSGAGVRAGVSVIRVSGPHAKLVLQRMCPGGGGDDGLRQPGSDVAGGDGGEGGGGETGEGELIDQALVLWLPGPRSFTGEDTVELHTHGSPAVVSATLEALGRLSYHRLAEPGEFTRQAHANGRMDLTEVEALGDLINAQTDAQRRQALAAMGGGQRRLLEAWRGRMVRALAHTEALIDFGEDADDVTEAALSSAVGEMQEIRREIESELEDGGRGEAVRDGVRVAILGPPNAGKSSLLNLLARREAAIVSPIEGTTRDVVTVSLQLGGMPVVLSDTAGLRSGSEDPIERLGMVRSADEAAKAHVQLWVFDASTPVPPVLDAASAAASPATATAATATSPAAADSAAGEDADGVGAEATGGVAGAPLQLLLRNKIDLSRGGEGGAEGGDTAGGVPAERQWRISCTTGEGVAPFLDQLGGIVRQLYGSDEGETPLVTRARHRQHLEGCVAALAQFQGLEAEERSLVSQHWRSKRTRTPLYSGSIPRYAFYSRPVYPRGAPNRPARDRPPALRLACSARWFEELASLGCFSFFYAFFLVGSWSSRPSARPRRLTWRARSCGRPRSSSAASRAAWTSRRCSTSSSAIFVSASSRADGISSWERRPYVAAPPPD